MTIFYDGGAPRVARRVTAMRRALGMGHADVLWRDLRRFPAALTCWDIGPRAWRGRIFVVDRCGCLRRGRDALRALPSEAPSFAPPTVRDVLNAFGRAHMNRPGP